MKHAISIVMAALLLTCCAPKHDGQCCCQADCKVECKAGACKKQCCQADCKVECKAGKCKKQCCCKAQTVSVIPEEYATANPEGMQKVHDFIKDCGYYFIATAEGDQPRVRPFGTINIFEGKLYIQTGHVKNVAKQIAANGKVELCAYNGNAWIRLSGTLVEDPRIEAKKAMLDTFPNLRGMYDENDDNIGVYFFTNAKATINTFAPAPETIEF